MVWKHVCKECQSLLQYISVLPSYVLSKFKIQFNLKYLRVLNYLCLLPYQFAPSQYKTYIPRYYARTLKRGFVRQKNMDSDWLSAASFLSLNNILYRFFLFSRVLMDLVKILSKKIRRKFLTEKLLRKSFDLYHYLEPFTSVTKKLFIIHRTYIWK